MFSQDEKIKDLIIILISLEFLHNLVPLYRMSDSRSSYVLPTVLNNNECMIGIPLKIAFDIVFTQHIRVYSLGVSYKICKGENIPKTTSE
jgi:hypothetical protein